MKPILLALVSAAVCVSSYGLGAQAPPQSALIRDVAPSPFTLVARADGSVVGWGSDPSELGVKTAPTVIELPGKALGVAVGGDSANAYVLLEDGTVVAWGANDEGQLGNGARGAKGVLGVHPKRSATPVKVTGLADIIAVKAGRKHAVALRKDGTVWAWGTRDNGALGDGDAAPGSLRVMIALAPVAVPGLEGITQIAVGPTHNLALRRDGRVLSWGANNAGELGVGTRATGWTPAEVTGLDRVVAIAAGNAVSNGVSGAVRDDGTVWIWGTNASAMMGNGQGPTAPDDPGGRNLLPMQVAGVSGAKGLSIGGGHVAALLADGSLRMWGHNGYGEIGKSAGGAYVVRPLKITAIADVAAVYLGTMRSYAVRSDGTFWFWGFGAYRVSGVLGKNQNVPTLVDLR